MSAKLTRIACQVSSVFNLNSCAASFCCPQFSLFHVKQNGLFSKEKFHIVFYAVYSGNSKIINEYFCYIRTEKCRECRSEVDIFHTKIQEGEKHNNGFLFVPGDIINDWKLIDIVEFEYFF